MQKGQQHEQAEYNARNEKIQRFCIQPTFVDCGKTFMDFALPKLIIQLDQLLHWNFENVPKTVDNHW